MRPLPSSVAAEDPSSSSLEVSEVVPYNRLPDVSSETAESLADDEDPSEEVEQWLTRKIHRPTERTSTAITTMVEDEERDEEGARPSYSSSITGSNDSITSISCSTEDEPSPRKKKQTEAENWLTRSTLESISTTGQHQREQEQNSETSWQRPAVVPLPPPPPSSPPRNSTQRLREKLRQRIWKRQLEREEVEQSPVKESGPPERPTSPRTEIGVRTPRKQLSEQPQDSYSRLSRTARYGGGGRRGDMATPRQNSIKLHIYDLLAKNTIMQLPFGVEFPIGSCLQSMNDGLQALGTGAYHCGIEVNGIEYAFGANDVAGTSGVFTCLPKYSSGYEYRCCIDFGMRSVTQNSWQHVVPTTSTSSSTTTTTTSSSHYKMVHQFVDGRDVMREMASEYMGIDYDLLKRNCCTFAQDACLRLGVSQEEIPQWFRTLADTGAATLDAAEQAMAALSPSMQLHRKRAPIINNDNIVADEEDGGFEVIAKTNCGASGSRLEIIKVVDALTVKNGDDSSPDRQSGGDYSFRRTLSWTY